MTTDNFMVQPVERVQKPQVVRRVGVQDYQPEKDEEHSDQSGSKPKNKDKRREKPLRSGGCIVADHKIDCRI